MSSNNTNDVDVNVLAEEIANARDTYPTLDDRMNKVEESNSTILERLQNMVIAAGGDLVEDVAIDNTGHLVMSIKTWDNPNESRLAIGSIELRHDGAYIQWRVVGFTNWTNLISLRDLTPKFKATIAITDDSTPSAVVSGTPSNPSLDLSIPKTLMNPEYGFLSITVNGTTLQSTTLNGVTINTDGNVAIDVNPDTNSLYIRLSNAILEKINNL